MPDAPPVITTTLPVMSSDFPAGPSIFSSSANRSIDGTIAERLSEHVRTARGALGQSRTGLPRRAVRAVELRWKLQVRSCKPDPFGADVVHLSEDRRNGAGLSPRFGPPGGRVKMFDQNPVDAIICRKDPDCRSTELRVNLGLTRGQGSLLELYRFRAVG
jgi:hypothetical protein